MKPNRHADDHDKDKRHDDNDENGGRPGSVLAVPESKHLRCCHKEGFAGIFPGVRCRAPVLPGSKCGICSVARCSVHLFHGLCWRCFAVTELDLPQQCPACGNLFHLERLTDTCPWCSVSDPVEETAACSGEPFAHSCSRKVVGWPPKGLKKPKLVKTKPKAKLLLPKAKASPTFRCAAVAKAKRHGKPSLWGRPRGQRVPTPPPPPRQVPTPPPPPRRDVIPPWRVRK